VMSIFGKLRGGSDFVEKENQFKMISNENNCQDFLLSSFSLQSSDWVLFSWDWANKKTSIGHWETGSKMEGGGDREGGRHNGGKWGTELLHNVP